MSFFMFIVNSTTIRIPSIEELTLTSALAHDYEWKKAKEK